MKVLVEANFQLAEEPTCFSSVEPLQRRVYVWSDKRAYLQDDTELEVYRRVSQFVEEPSLAGCIEVWAPSQAVVPSSPDDIWTDTFKQLQLDSVTIEWFPPERLIRLSWVQTLNSLTQRKLPARALQQLQELSLEFPPLPLLLAEPQS